MHLCRYYLYIDELIETLQRSEDGSYFCMAEACRDSIEKAFLSYAFGEAMYDKNAH